MIRSQSACLEKVLYLPVPPYRPAFVPHWSGHKAQLTMEQTQAGKPQEHWAL